MKAGPQYEQQGVTDPSEQSQLEDKPVSLENILAGAGKVTNFIKFEPLGTCLFNTLFGEAGIKHSWCIPKQDSCLQENHLLCFTCKLK
jgi:hypothetical protein